MSKFINLAGQKLGKLSVIRRASLPGKVKWDCLCDCGNEKTIAAMNLRAGTRSCGCLAVERSTSHGMARSAEYHCWIAMKNRCFTESSQSYEDYGARGITVCERWKSSFENFLNDMGRKPSSEHSIERDDNDGNYEPTNCHWVVPLEQCQNRRSNKHLVIGGRKLTLAQAAREKNISYRTVLSRIRQGWDVTTAIATPARNYGNHD